MDPTVSFDLGGETLVDVLYPAEFVFVGLAVVRLVKQSPPCSFSASRSSWLGSVAREPAQSACELLP
ncbi:hypothetical protein [Mesorhizobium sangaii]|uniref:Uncharacterized protein n=1 Tax=Mesorhizobium sangaii TaxID=505389 RepID=A0A841PMC1_9HYPH|nr:hypothetical protein [Mesorhizobium sangaii]MBB6411312.1 hypothetical protein [Mesorhizobium sangaii]